jgi:hypothetical protein
VLAATTLIALGGISVSVIAPIEVDLQHEPVHTADDLVIIADPTDTVTAAVVATPSVQRDPVMLFVYLGIMSLLAIVATAAYLAF